MNYIGSKYSLLEFIDETITKVVGKENIKDKVFADLFAGTGVVGNLFRCKGCKVIANDIQYYSYVLNKHYLQSNSKTKVDKLEHLNHLESKEGFVYNNFCWGSGSKRLYFTDENGKKCDAIRSEIENLFKKGIIEEDEYFTYLAGLINSIDKVANTASVYGAFLKKIKRSASKDLDLTLLEFTDGIKGDVYNEDISVLIEQIQGDILYLDPPYNQRQYCANYHVLETIARNDEPELKGKTGLRDYTKEKSKFCSKKTVLEEFEFIISKAHFKYIFLSYNNEGLMSLSEIEEIMSKYGKYSIFQKEYRRYKADKDENRNISSSETTEYLHCLIKE